VTRSARHERAATGERDPPDRSSAPEQDWGCSWEATRRRRLTAGLTVTPAERLAWLEEMIELAAASGALPRRGP